MKIPGQPHLKGTFFNFQQWDDVIGKNNFCALTKLFALTVHRGKIYHRGEIIRGEEGRSLDKSGTWQGINVRQEAIEAEGRIRAFILETPLEYSHELSSLGGARAHLKLEIAQVTGSFKLRGAANLLLSLSKEERDRGVVTSSTGNHGTAFAYLLNRLGGKGTIYAPETIPSAKAETLRSYGVDLQLHGNDCLRTEIYARTQAEKSGAMYIPPYNHPKIIGGQATVAMELERRMDKMDAVLVPVGGGGLMSGIAGYLKSGYRQVEIIGCQPENSPVMAASIEAGRILDMASLPTLADGTAGGIEPGSVPFDICRDCTDDFILVSEKEIENAIRFILEKHQFLIEGAAALSVAAFMKNHKRFKDKEVVLILTGKRLGLDALKTVLNRR